MWWARTQTDAVVLVILVIPVVARAALRYYVTTLSMHARAMRWKDGKLLELGRRDKVASPGPSFPIIRAWRSAFTRHAYKAVFIVAVTGQQAVRDLSRRGEVERIFIQVSKH